MVKASKSRSRRKMKGGGDGEGGGGGEEPVAEPTEPAGEKPSSWKDRAVASQKKLTQSRPHKYISSGSSTDTTLNYVKVLLIAIEIGLMIWLIMTSPGLKEKIDGSDDSESVKASCELKSNLLTTLTCVTIFQAYSSARGSIMSDAARKSSFYKGAKMVQTGISISVVAYVIYNIYGIGSLFESIRFVIVLFVLSMLLIYEKIGKK